MATAATKGTVEDRLARAKARQDNPPKSKFGLKKPTKDDVHTVNSASPASGDQNTPRVHTKSDSGDQNSAHAPVSGDQNEVKRKRVRKPSATVTAWKNQENFPVDAVITINGDYATKNPKRRDAARRFSLYKDGMTVADYITTAKEAGISGALATADVRWDAVKGYITVK